MAQFLPGIAWVVRIPAGGAPDPLTARLWWHRMSAFHWFFLLFLIVPLAEIYVLLEVGSVLGALPTVAAVVLTALIGAALVRAQGFSTLMRIRASLDAGDIPAMALLEGAFLLVAGALLLTPGFLTDTIGFIFLSPPIRRALIEHFLIEKLAATQRHPDEPGGPRVIEGDFRRKDKTPRNNNELR
jgi:UPF0716 protein FxsA